MFLRELTHVSVNLCVY